MEDGLDIVAIRVVQEGSVVAGVVGSFSWSAIVATTSGKSGLMEPPHSLLILRLERQMHMCRRICILTESVYPELVASEMPVVIGPKRDAERTERRTIECRRGREILGSQVDMVDQTTSVQYHAELP